MIKTMLVSSGFMLVAAVFADEASAAGPCAQIFDPFSCEHYPSGECFWDSLDTRCEQRMGGGGICERFVSPGMCNSNPLCFWDLTDLRCEPR